MDLQTILGKLFANAGAVGIEGVFQFVLGPQLACWSEVKASTVPRPVDTRTRM